MMETFNGQLFKLANNEILRKQPQTNDTQNMSGTHHNRGSRSKGKHYGKKETNGYYYKMG